MGLDNYDEVFTFLSKFLQIDREGTMYVLSDRLPAFMYQQLDPNDYNFRILTGKVREAVSNTVCSGTTTIIDSGGKLKPMISKKDEMDTRINRLPSLKSSASKFSTLSFWNTLLLVLSMLRLQCRA